MLKHIVFSVLLAASSSAVLAQYDNQRKAGSSSSDSPASGSRNGRLESSVILAYQNGLDVSSEGGAMLDVDAEMGWGFSIGWNWTQNVNFSYRMTLTKPDYTATIIPEEPSVGPQTLDHTITKYSHQLSATYNFSKKDFTPFVTGGLGWTEVDSNVPSGLPQTGCWWDPWWGYICFNTWKTFKASEISYHVGLGVRWDINNALFSRATYSREFLDLDNGSLDFDMAILEIGLMF